MLPRKRKILSREDVGFAFPEREPTEAQAGRLGQLWMGLAQPGQGRPSCRGAKGPPWARLSSRSHKWLIVPPDSRALGLGGKVEIVCIGRVNQEGLGIILLYRDV